MGLFSQENMIKCGKCSTEFDLGKNKGGCPLCGFGRSSVEVKPIKEEKKLLLKRMMEILVI